MKSSNLRNSNGLQPISNGLQPKSDGLQPNSNGLQPNSNGLYTSIVTLRSGGQHGASCLSQHPTLQRLDILST